MDDDSPCVNLFLLPAWTVIFAICLILLLSGVMLRIIHDRPPLSETVIIPFDRYESTLTQQQYSGPVRLIISGTGRAGGIDFSDAFYLYAQGNGRPYTLPVTEQFDLEIDGDRAIYTLGFKDRYTALISRDLPPYARDHVYEVQYDVKNGPRPIAFRISDQIVSDNSGRFVILIVDGPVANK